MDQIVDGLFVGYVDDERRQFELLEADCVAKQKKFDAARRALTEFVKTLKDKYQVPTSIGVALPSQINSLTQLAETYKRVKEREEARLAAMSVEEREKHEAWLATIERRFPPIDDTKPR